MTKFEFVLILVLMEYTLLPSALMLRSGISPSLNPCFNGIYSFTKKEIFEGLNAKQVLILVLMEYTLLPNSLECDSLARTAS